MLFLFLVLNAARAAPAAAVGAQYYDGYNMVDAFKKYGGGALNQIFAGRRFDEPLKQNEFITFLEADTNKSLTTVTRINEALTLVQNFHLTTNFYHRKSAITKEILEDIYRNATQLYSYFTQPVKEIDFNGMDSLAPPTRGQIAEQIMPSHEELTNIPTNTLEYDYLPPGEEFSTSATDSKELKDDNYVIPPTRGRIEEPKLPSRSPPRSPTRSPSREEFDSNTPTNTTDYDYLRQVDDFTTIATSLKSSNDGFTEEIKAAALPAAPPIIPSVPPLDAPPTAAPIASLPAVPPVSPIDAPLDVTLDIPQGDTQDTSPVASLDAPEDPLARAAEAEEKTCKPDPTTTTTTTTKKTTLQFDIDKFLEIVANLTFDYYTNLTAQVNQTLRKMSMMPTCPTLSPPPTEFDYTLFNDSLRGKCFVCGMEDKGIPHDANCADAFAGDFIPLVPQNPKAKGQIAMYRKYCAFRDVNNFVINKTMPRMMWGRWTGGCSVRWTDLSGVYTQRTCRSKYKAAVGKNYASKRMAKLEMALSHIDNGCIISPVATLLPLSRGISLFARIHACVCTGSWCNGAPVLQVAVSMLVAMVTSLVFFK